MKLGAYTACLHDKPLPEALQTLRDLGLDSAEINSGGFLPAAHLPIAELRASEDARDGVPRAVRRGRRHAHGAQLQRQPAAPRSRGARQARPGRARRDRAGGAAGRQARGHDVRAAGRRAPARTCRRGPSCRGTAPTSTPGLPVERGGHPVLEGRPGPRRATPTSRSASRCTRTTSSSTRPRWSGSPPRSTPRTSARRWTPATCSGRASTRSPPSSALGDLVYNAAAKDTRINQRQVNGVLDDRFGRVRPTSPGAVLLGGRYTPQRLADETRRGTSSRSGGATTSTSGRDFLRRWRRSTRTWP